MVELPDPFYTPVETTQALVPQTLPEGEFEILPAVETTDWSAENSDVGVWDY